MPKIKIYTTPTCVYCNKAKEFFKKFGLNFEEINVLQNENAVYEIMQKTGQMAVPIIEINNQIIVGFKELEIKKALNLI
jgi:glutaredoxin-like YruB-family protein